MRSTSHVADQSLNTTPERLQLIQLGVAITQPHFPALGLSAFGADSAAHWIVGGRDGLVFDGDAILAASPDAPPRPLGAP